MTNTTNQKDRSAASDEAPGYGYPLPFRHETDKHDIVRICDAEGGAVFELNTHTQRPLDDKEGLAQERAAAESFAAFIVDAVNALTTQAAPEAPALDPMLGECAANMNGHRFGPHGINGERQCEWCAAAPAVTPTAPSREAAPQIKTWQERYSEARAAGTGPRVPMGLTEMCKDAEIADLRAALAQQGAAQGSTTGKGEQHGK